MKPAFIAFAATLTLLMAASAIVGVGVSDEVSFSRHFALGLMTTLFTCLCHCVVLAYFMATGKMMRIAVEDARLEPQLTELAQRLKIRAYAALMPAILAALLAAFAGGWATINAAQTRTHLVLVILSACVQLAVFYREYTLIHDNGRLMDRVFLLHEQVRRLASSTDAAPNSPP